MELSANKRVMTWSGSVSLRFCSSFAEEGRVALAKVRVVFRGSSTGSTLPHVRKAFSRPSRRAFLNAQRTRITANPACSQPRLVQDLHALLYELDGKYGLIKFPCLTRTLDHVHITPREKRYEATYTSKPAPRQTFIWRLSNYLKMVISILKVISCYCSHRQKAFQVSSQHGMLVLAQTCTACYLSHSRPKIFSHHFHTLRVRPAILCAMLYHWERHGPEMTNLQNHA